MKNTAKIWMPILFVAMTLAAQEARADRVGGGFKLGMNVATLSGDQADAANAESITGLVAGAFLRVDLNDFLAVQPELLFSRNGAKGDTLGIEGTVKLDYIEVPVLLRCSFGRGAKLIPAFFLGPAVLYRLAANAEADNGLTRSLDQSVRRTDFGLVFGADFSVPLGRPQVTIEARSTLGLTNIDDTGSGADIRNRAFSIILGMYFSSRD
jgi:hypothetical protein